MTALPQFAHKPPKLSGSHQTEPVPCPGIVKELGNLLQLMVCQRVDILPQLLQSELRLRFAVRMVKDIHQLPDNSSDSR
jgi:hypothetical protein